MIFGRASELEQINAFLAAAQDGPAALLLEGELGAGKTALWKEAVARARCRVMTCRPVEAETQLPYTALGDLLASVSDDELAQLPGPQRHALEVALLRAEPREQQLQRAVALGFLRVLHASPTIVAVDDAQWLDPESETVLAFVARRLSRGGLLVARRGVGVVPLGLEHPRVVTVGPLGEADLARALAERRGEPVPRPEAARLHRESGGNPFFALELLGRETVPAGLRGLVEDRLDALSDAGLEAVELASALSRPTSALVDAAAAPGVLEADAAPGTAASPRGAAAPAADARDATRVRFAHPLLATVAYERVVDKRALHARLAALVDEPEERARHLALAADAPDEDVAAALDDAARRARARGAPAAAAALLEQARRLTRGPGWARGVEAAERHLEAGDAERARALLEEVLDEAPAGRDRAYALARLGWVRAHRDGFREAAAEFARALAEPDVDAALRIEIEQGLSWCVHSISTVAEAQVHARRALALAEELGEPTLLAHALSHVAFLDSLTGNGMALDQIERALALNPDPGWTQILGRPDWIHALLLLWDGRLVEARDRLAALHEEALERGDEHSLPFVLFQLARVELLLGDWPAARRHALECGESTAQSGQVGERPYAAAIEALVAAHVGAVDEARAHIGAGLALAEQLGVQPAALELLAVQGFLELSLGDAEAADATFGELRARVVASGLKEPALFRWHADAIEAKVLLGRAPDIPLDRSRPWVQSVAARCDALLGETGAAAASGAAGASGVPPASDAAASQPFERARTLLVLGARERRNRQWRAAREALGEALAAFEALGAPLWADKARAELSRVGGRAPADDGLTPTERKVAELIAAGRTYQEAADALFISPKTVQWNLSKVYRKLGIKSRAELPGRLPSD